MALRHLDGSLEWLMHQGALSVVLLIDGPTPPSSHSLKISVCWLPHLSCFLASRV